ncbi:peptidase [Amylibacter sp. SFDW26]|uniref:peptidylprolyl isomerase n=1 Tax=Amylibacter sp. SFDW26 TaxID=2652722 RepID=UPI0012617FCD|nr:peptidylprolyl isomerase [Amylibacter sp. SFDW26]KAB7610177.1 peptidase [Amylibacter sp. SFDW26]
MNRPLFPDVIVNGETIPQADIAAEAQQHEAPAGKPGVAWRSAAKALVVRNLLLQEARKKGVVSEPAELGEGRRETHDEALMRNLLDDAVNPATPTNEEVYAFWEKDPSRFMSPPLWEASHILSACDIGDDDSVAAAKARAVAITKRAHANPKGFARLAHDESDCSSKASGGALGQLGPNDTVPEFEVVLVDMEPGQITLEPIQTRFGFHVVKLDACAEQNILPFDAVKKQLTEALQKAAWAKAAQEFVGELVKSAEIKGVDMLAA